MTEEMFLYSWSSCSNGETAVFHTCTRCGAEVREGARLRHRKFHENLDGLLAEASGMRIETVTVDVL
jgi:hypothetical protein